MPSPEQISIAAEAFKRALDKLPNNVVKRLERRFQEYGHCINTVRYYPFPIVVDNGSRRFAQDCIEWGGTYAGILRKIVTAYRSTGNSNCRRFLWAALMKYLEPHLVHLIEAYRTVDDLAGSHLGDDAIAGKSVEWNLGAVGGLDEGYSVAREIAKFRLSDNSNADENLMPVERDPAAEVRDALSWAYESFCLANGITAGSRPFIACTEYDDIYGSTVSICERMKEMGADADVCFAHEFVYRGQNLLTASGKKVDLVYMDCHLEDFSADHPLIQAAAANAVGLDCSPLAHLVLRSKVVTALLYTPAFLKELGLTSGEEKMINRHLMPTFLWRRRSLRDATLPFSPVADSMSSTESGPYQRHPFSDDEERRRSMKRFVLKIATGSVYGGSSVAVLKKSGNSYNTTSAKRLVSSLVRSIAADRTMLYGTELHSFLKVPLKDFIRNMLVMALSRRVSGNGTNDDYSADPFWGEVTERWGNVLKRSSSTEVSVDSFIEVLSDPLALHFDIDLAELENCCPQFRKRLAGDLRTITGRRKNVPNYGKALDRLRTTVANGIASLQFQRGIGPEDFGAFLSDLKDVVKPRERITHTNLVGRVMMIVERFFVRHCGSAIPMNQKQRLSSLLLAPYIRKQIHSVNPVVVQEYHPPDVLTGEAGVHLMTRTHILFTRAGPQVFVSGAQVFTLKDGKQDNRCKMTGSLWSEPEPG